MSTSTTGSRALSIAAGTLFTAGALYILLEDVVLHAAPWTLKHVLTLIVVGGTILVGHLAAEAKSNRHWLAFAGFVALFVAGTALTVYNSVGRQAEHTMLKAAEAEVAEEARAIARKGLAEAEAMLSAAQRDLAKEAKAGGCKRVCEGIKATIAVYEAAVKGHQADLARLGPVKVAVPEARRAGELAAVFGFDAGKVEAGAILAVPFFTTLFLEFGAIVSFGYAFRRRPALAVANDNAVTVPEPAPLKRARVPSPARKPVAAIPADHPVIVALRRGPVSSQDELAGRMGVTKGEASKRVREVEQQLVIERDGRHHRIRLAG